MRPRASQVMIRGDDRSQRTIRFAIYHLTSAANPEDDRVSVGARGLHRRRLSRPRILGYRNLPAALLRCRLARGRAALLMYRYHTLGGARERQRISVSEARFTPGNPRAPASRQRPSACCYPTVQS